MQADNTDYQRHQLIEALGHCVQQLRSTAAMIDNYAGFIQGLPHAAVSLPMQNIFPMFTPPQTGSQPGSIPPAPVASNGIHATAFGSVQTPARGRKRRGAEPEVEGTIKRRRRRAPGEKKERDPNAPKRPPSAYLLFQNEVREEMKKAFPGLPYIEVLTKISERWSKMTDEEKKVYLDATNDMRAKFGVDKAAYEALVAEQHGTSLAGSATTPAAPAAALNTAPAAPTAPSAPSPPAPASVPALSDSSSEDEEEGSEASSGDAVSAEVQGSDATDSENDSREGVGIKPNSKKQGKPSSRPTAPTKPASKAKAEESKRKNKKSKEN